MAIGFALLCACLAAGIAEGQQPLYKGLEKLPDATTGEIDGQPAIVVWPVDDRKRELLDVKDCEVILERHDTSAFTYLEYPCGRWFVPEIARYDMWVEMPGYVSDAVTVYAFGGGEFHGVGARSLHSVVPAGRIRASSSAVVPPAAHSFRILSLRNQRVTYQRVVDAGAASTFISAPAGRVVAGFFDTDGNALALTRPFDLKAGATEDVAASGPEKGSDLLLVIAKAQSEIEPRRDIEVVLHTNGSGGAAQRKPDVLLDARDELVAIWYGLAASRVELVARPFWPKPRAVILQNAKVTTVRSLFTVAHPQSR